MTTQHVHQVPVVVDSPDVMRRLRAAVDEMSTARATAYAIALGLHPPTDAEWDLILYLDTYDSPGELVWELVTEVDD